jgi:hypothetical protein
MAYTFENKKRTVTVFLSDEFVAGRTIFSFQGWSEVLAVTKEIVDGWEQFLGLFVETRKATISFVMSVYVCFRASVCPSAWNTSALTGRIFMKFDIEVFVENL